MSARERLLDVLNGNYRPLEPLESLIDAYAHELAEKIRADELCSKPYHREHFARLIDPEACKPGCTCACHTADPSPCDDCSEVLNSE
jgi:hypothetical protein